MEIKNLLAELERQQKDLTNQLQKVQTAVTALKALNESTSFLRSVITTISPGVEKYKVETPNPRDFAISYIRSKGAETGINELFDQYNKTIGRMIRTSGERRKFRNRFFQMLAGKVAKKMGITHKVYRLEGMKEAYFNLDSAIKLQKEQPVQNPNVTITDVKL